MSSSTLRILSWRSIQNAIKNLYKVPDYINGPTNAHANLRLFPDPENSTTLDKKPPRVILYRDNHAWCPYCQKIWLFLEEKRIPYEIKKVTMFCYGQKEAWYKQIVPRGMLPALSIDGNVITESDVILAELEKEFGVLGGGGSLLIDKSVLANRKLERKLFSAWCSWLCRESNWIESEISAKNNFQSACKVLEARILETGNGYFMNYEFGISDCILAPYVERMQASLYYYKGFNMREEHPVIDRWFSAMEERSTYRGTKSDFHTHVHDLPPQMGGCYFDKFSINQDQSIREMVNSAVNKVDCPKQYQGTEIVPDREIDESKFTEPKDCRLEAIHRVLKHKDNMSKINPVKGEPFDLVLRAVCSDMLAENLKLNPENGFKLDDSESDLVETLPRGAGLASRYIRDRLSVPRDMSFWAGRRFRQALEKVAGVKKEEGGFCCEEDLAEYESDASGVWGIPFEHRRDSNPVPFRK